MNGYLEYLGIKVEFYYEKEEANKPILLFIHGFGDSMKTFLFPYKNIDRKFRIAAINFPNENNSDISWKLEDYAQIVKAFYNEHFANESVVYIASHSLGSYCALMLNQKENVKKTFLFSPFNPFLLENRDVSVFRTWLEPQNLEQLRQSYLHFFYDKNNPLIVKTISLLKDRDWSKRTKVLGKMINDQILNENFLKENVFDLFKKAKDIFIISGNEDEYTKKEGIIKISSQLSIPLTLFENKGHAIFFEAKNECLNFINEHIK